MLYLKNSAFFLPDGSQHNVPQKDVITSLSYTQSNDILGQPTRQAWKTQGNSSLKVYTIVQ